MAAARQTAIKMPPIPNLAVKPQIRPADTKLAYTVDPKLSQRLHQIQIPLTVDTKFANILIEPKSPNEPFLLPSIIEKVLCPKYLYLFLCYFEETPSDLF